jgi:hypothetical protein
MHILPVHFENLAHVTMTSQHSEIDLAPYFLGDQSAVLLSLMRRLGASGLRSGWARKFLILSIMLYSLS